MLRALESGDGGLGDTGASCLTGAVFGAGLFLGPHAESAAVFA